MILEKMVGASKAGLRNEVTRVAWVKSKLEGLSAGSRLLDAGAGERRFREFCQHLNYVSQDFGEYDGQGNQAGLQTGKWERSGLDIICDIVSIPEPNESFDGILCTEVLEHLPDPLAALREFTRLLRPGGQLIMTAPFCSLTHFAPFHFSTGFNRYFYDRHLDALGFDITEMIPNGNFFEFMAQELRRIDDISKRFSGEKMTPLEAVAVKTVLKALERFSSKDRGSSELLNFGLHVLAVKRIPTHQ